MHVSLKIKVIVSKKECAAFELSFLYIIHYESFIKTVINIISNIYIIHNIHILSSIFAKILLDIMYWLLTMLIRVF